MSGTGTPDAIAISSMTLRRRRHTGLVVSAGTGVAPRPRATTAPPPRRLARRYIDASAIITSTATLTPAIIGQSSGPNDACRAAAPAMPGAPRGCPCRPNASTTTMSTATITASTASTNNTTSRRLLRRTFACWAKKSIGNACRRTGVRTQVKETLGTSRASGFSSSSCSAGWKPKLPATAEAGNVWQWLL